MASHEWIDDDNAALLTDLYELTMLQAYFAEGMKGEAVFDLFVRRLGQRNYLLACGLDTFLHYLEHLRFKEEAISYLGTLDIFTDGFLQYLSDFRFTGDVYAVAEGTPVFADEPILEVVAPISEAQLVETFVLNQVTFQTNVATKARRVVAAAGGRTVADFGLRRMHGADAGLRAARAFHVAGVDATSNVLAGHVYGLPVTGTMAHSYVQAHGNERDAFDAFARRYPGTTLLVDTYDTLDGVRRVIEVARVQGDAFSVAAIRLDSGDLGALAREARRLLDDAGLDQVKIFASSSLDEHRIAALVGDGAPVDGFGVGTKMGTSADQPYLDSAYKLCAYAGEPCMKLSEEKSNLPGRKQVFRRYEGGVAVGDVIARAGETLAGEPLLRCVMKRGRRTEAGSASLDAARTHARTCLEQLPAHLLQLDPADPPYDVGVSDGLQHLAEETRVGLQRRMAR